MALTQQTPYTDTTGLKIYVPITGLVSPPLKVSTSITGFSDTVAGLSDNILSAKTIGNLIELTLNTAITTGQTVLLSYSSVSGNVQDQASNALTTFSAVAVTNNTNVASFSQTLDIGKVFQFGVLTNRGTVSAHANTYGFTGLNSGIAFNFKGTALTLLNYLETSGASGMTYSIDGGAFVTPTLTGAGSWVTNLSLATGLTDTVHTVIMYGLTANNVFNIDGVNTLSVTGSNPYIDYPYPTAIQTTITAAAPSSSGTYLINEQNGLIPVTINSYTNIYKHTPNGGAGVGNFCDAFLRFNATISGLLILVSSGTQWVLSVDGVDGSIITAPSTPGTYTLCLMSSTLDATTQHLYTLKAISALSTAQFIYSIVVYGGTGINTSGSPTARTSYFAGYGDSIVQGASTGSPQSNYPTSNGYLYKLQELLGETWGFANRGIASTLVSGNAATTGQDRTADITSLAVTPIVPSIVIINYGRNDCAQLQNVTQATFQAAFYTMMNLLTTGLGSAKFLVMFIMPEVTTNISNETPLLRAEWNQLIVNSCATSGAGMGKGDNVNYLSSGQAAQITFIDTMGTTWNDPWVGASAGLNGVWVDPGSTLSTLSTTGGSGIHPSPLGNTGIAARLLPYFSSATPAFGTAYTSLDGTTVFLRLTAAPPFTAGNVPPTGLTLKINGTPVSISSAGMSNTEYVAIVSSQIIQTSDTVTLSYNSGTGNIQAGLNANGNLTSFTNQPVTNNSRVAPLVGTISAAISGVDFSADSSGDLILTYTIEVPDNSTELSATSNGVPVSLSGQTLISFNSQTLVTTYGAGGGGFVSGTIPDPALIFKTTNGPYTSSQTSATDLFTGGSGGRGGSNQFGFNFSL